jgi:hypothetical protein
MPETVIVYAVGIQEGDEITEKMTTKVEKTVPRVVALVLEELNLSMELTPGSMVI